MLERSEPLEQAVADAKRALSAEGFSLEIKEAIRDEESGLRVVQAEGFAPHSKLTVHAVGKGIALQSEASALFELIEHAAALGCFQQSTAVITKDNPNNLISDKLSSFARKNSVERYIPFFPIDSDLQLTGEIHLFPAAACDLSLEAENSAERTLGAYCSSNGYAAGSSVKDALLHALNEVIERDAIGHHLILSTLHRTSLESYPPSAIGDPSIRLYMESLSGQVGSRLHVSFLEGLAGSTAAVYTAPVQDAAPTIIGYGSSAFPHYAVERAVSEAQQEYWAALMNFNVSEDGGIDTDDYLKQYPNLLAARHASVVGNRLASSTEVQVNVLEFQKRVNLIDELTERGYSAFGRVVWRSKHANVVVCQVVIGGAERFSMIRFGLPIQPTGRRTVTSDARLMMKRVTSHPNVI